MGYTKQVYDRAWAELARRKAKAGDESIDRRRQIHGEIPEIARIEREMARQASGITKIVIGRPAEADTLIHQLAQDNLALQKRRSELLEQAGYPADYLAERHGCMLCKDSGYRGTQMCDCLRQLLRQEAGARLGRASPVGRCTFQGFSLRYYPDEVAGSTGISPRARMQEVLAYCRRYAQRFAPQAESLLLMGQTGLGKTHLSLAIAGEVTGAGFGVVYAPVQRMMDELEAEKFSRAPDAKERYGETAQGYLDCDLLVLDDLGTEFQSQFTTSALFHVLNTRLVEERPTIISTNLSMEEIESRYSQRMVSRLICAYKVLLFAGKDIRYIKKLESQRQA